MDISLAEERAFQITPQVPLEVAKVRVDDKRTSLVAGTVGALLSRPKAEDIQLVSTEARLEPFWLVTISGRTRYDRNRSFAISVSGPEVQQITVLDHQVKVDPAQLDALNLTGKVPEGTTHLAAWKLIWAQIGLIDARTFWTFGAAASAIKFVGILSSMYRWLVLLRGQGIELPFRHIFGSFLIGRFIGTFLPSTAGLDGYKLYDAARFTGRTVEVTATTALEKVLGVFGIFLSFLVALPFGIKIFGEQGPLVAAITVPLALGLIGALLVVLWFPGLVQWLLTHLPIPGKAKLEGVPGHILRQLLEAFRDG